MNVSRKFATTISGKPAYNKDDIAEELENRIDMLEADGLEPDAGRILRKTLASSKYDVKDATTPIERSRRGLGHHGYGGPEGHGLFAPSEDSRLRKGRGRVRRSGHLPLSDERTIRRKTKRAHIGFLVQAAKVGTDESIATVAEG